MSVAIAEKVDKGQLIENQMMKLTLSVIVVLTTYIYIYIIIYIYGLAVNGWGRKTRV